MQTRAHLECFFMDFSNEQNKRIYAQFFQIIHEDTSLNSVDALLLLVFLFFFLVVTIVAAFERLHLSLFQFQF